MDLNKNKNYVNILHPLHRNIVLQTKKNLLFSFQPKLNKKTLKTKCKLPTVFKINLSGITYYRLPAKIIWWHLFTSKTLRNISLIPKNSWPAELSRWILGRLEVKLSLRAHWLALCTESHPFQVDLFQYIKYIRRFLFILPRQH